MPTDNKKSESKASQLKVNDRVKRVSGDSCFGTIKDIREEASANSRDNRERALLVNVLWDNGTLSSFSPQSLEVVS